MVAEAAGKNLMMKKFIQIFAFLFCFLAFSQEEVVELPIDYGDTQYERIVSFDSDIKIAENADVTVTETIKVYATGNQIKRGIFRAFPTIRNINGRKEKVLYDIISVEKDGVKEPYHNKKENGIFTIYIGDKDSYLSSGFYMYKIVYKTQDQIGKFNGYDEFYWNVNGTDWSFPVEKIHAKIHLPKNADILQNSCYTGKEGSTEKNCSSTKISSTEIEFDAENLNQHENLTVAVGFKAGILKEPSSFSKWIKRNWVSLPLFFAGFYLLFFYFQNWKKFGKDPEKPVVIPQFNAPNNLSAASLGYIDKEKFDASLVTANLVDLSIKGFVEIEEVKDPAETYLSRIFSLKKIDSNSDNLQSDQKLLLQKIFENGKKVVVNGTYNSKIKNAVIAFEKIITKENQIYVEKNSNIKLVYKALKIILACFFLALIVNSLVIWDVRILAIVLIVSFFGGIFAAILVAIWQESNNIVRFVILFFSLVFISPLFAFAFVNSDDVSQFESNCIKFLIFSVLSLFVFRYFINSPSIEKVKMKSEIDGFKMYLSTAEEDQLKFHNPPEMTSDVYEKFLPYAIVFGVEGIWGKRFRDQLQETIDGESYVDVQNQFGYSFANSFTGTLQGSTVAPVSSFSSSSSSSSSPSRSSSSSSYSGGSSSSGSSGGGSSGGGGGGGGGGGW